MSSMHGPGMGHGSMQSMYNSAPQAIPGHMHPHSRSYPVDLSMSHHPMMDQVTPPSLALCPCAIPVVVQRNCMTTVLSCNCCLEQSCLPWLDLRTFVLRIYPFAIYRRVILHGGPMRTPSKLLQSLQLAVVCIAHA